MSVRKVLRESAPRSLASEDLSPMKHNVQISTLSDSISQDLEISPAGT